jgi:hypothetical protein
MKLIIKSENETTKFWIFLIDDLVIS